MTQNHATKGRSAQTSRLVVTVVLAVTSALFVLTGQPLAAVMVAVVGLVTLIEAIRLDERSIVAKRISSVLVLAFAALSVIYLYTSFFS